jgi:Holliday junction resolvase
MSSTKGDRWERNYRNALCATDSEADADDIDRVGVDSVDAVEPFVAVRMPSSGSATREDLPDLHVWYVSGSVVREFAVEVKAGRDRVRLDNSEVPALRRYADSTASEPIVFVHIDYVGDFVVPVDDLHSTDKGYTFTESRDAGDAVTFAEWVQSVPTV